MTMSPIAFVALGFQASEPAPPHRPIQLPPRWRVEGTVDRLSLEQQIYLVPPWTGTAEQLLTAERDCRSTYGDGARVKIRDRYASCCPTDETPFGLCDSLTFKQD